MQCERHRIKHSAFRLRRAVGMRYFQAIRRSRCSNVENKPVRRHCTPFRTIIAVKGLAFFLTGKGRFTSAQNLRIAGKQYRFGGRNRRIKLQLVNADVLSPASRIGSADIDLKDASGCASKVICRNVIQIIGCACNQLPVTAVFKQRAALFIGLGKKLLHGNLAFIQNVELIARCVNLTRSRRPFVGRTRVDQFKLCYVTLFPNIECNPFVVSVDAPFSGIRIGDISVKQFFRSLRAAEIVSVVCNNTGTKRHVLGFRCGFRHRDRRGSGF